METQLRAGYRCRADVQITMTDGIVLRADVYTPEGAGPWPVMLQRTPYDKNNVFGTQHINSMPIPNAVARGFAVVIQDTRGRYSSEGVFDPFVHEAADGTDTVEWILGQDFSDGRVCLYGASYVGATQWLTASTNPPGVVAFAPYLTSNSYHDSWLYRGGALELSFAALWTLESLAPADIGRRPFGTEQERKAAAALLDELSTDPARSIATVSPVSEALRSMAPYLADFVEAPADSLQWTSTDVSTVTTSIRAAGLHIAGWYDIFLEGGLDAFIQMRQPDSANPEAQYLIVGPWSHGNPSDWQGDKWLGYSANVGAFGLHDLQLDFFDAVIHDRQPVTPRVSYFTTGIDRWQSATDWPVPGSETQSLFLGDNGRLASDAPAHPGEACFKTDPDAPVPTTGGASFLPGLLLGRNSGPKLQTEVEERADVLLFTSEPLEANLEVTGTVFAQLWASSDQACNDLAVRLCDVDPEGQSFSLTDGIQRYKTATAGMHSVRVGSISHVFRASHRIRIQIAGSNFPRFDINQHSADDAASLSHVAHQQVSWGPGMPSRILLPTVPA